MKELPIDKGKIAELARLARHCDVPPLFLPNYLSESKTHPISAPLRELADEAFGYLSVLRPEEIAQLLTNLSPGISMMIEPETELNRDEYLKRVSVYYIVHEVNRHHFPFRAIVDEELSRSAVLKQYPELRRRMDKDGLVEVTPDLVLHDGGIEYHDHMLHYHQLFRRAYRGQPNFDFTTRFLQYYKRTNARNAFRIAIDHQRLMPKEYYSKISEFDTWYGPPFHKDKLDDPNEVGLTVVRRNPDSLFNLTNKLDRTEFYWSFKNAIKTLQIEEVCSRDYSFDDYYFNKYVHSQRDIDSKITMHLDGSVKVYLKDRYEKRFDSNIPNEDKCHKKIKLWRIDGDIELDEWSELISLFYKGNEMIIEYFDPQKFEELFELRIRDYEAWKKQGQSEREQPS